MNLLFCHGVCSIACCSSLIPFVNFNWFFLPKCDHAHSEVVRQVFCPSISYFGLILIQSNRRYLLVPCELATIIRAFLVISGKMWFAAIVSSFKHCMPVLGTLGDWSPLEICSFCCIVQLLLEMNDGIFYGIAVGAISLWGQSFSFPLDDCFRGIRIRFCLICSMTNIHSPLLAVLMDASFTCFLVLQIIN